MPKTSEKTTAPTDKTGSVSWSPVMAILVVIAVYFAASIIGELALLTYGFIRSWSVSEVAQWATDSTFAQFFSIFVIYTAMTLIVAWFVRSQKVSLRVLGVVRPRLRDLGWALIAVPVYIAGYALLLAVMTQLFPSIDVEQEQQLGFQPEGNVIALALTFVSLVILPPLVEEFIMRGFLFTSFLKKFRFAVAAVLTSIIFALAHLQFGSGAPLLWIAAIDTFILSLIMCYMRYRSGSLWPSITLHALKNGVAFLSLFVFHLK